MTPDNNTITPDNDAITPEILPEDTFDGILLRTKKRMKKTYLTSKQIAVLRTLKTY